MNDFIELVQMKGLTISLLASGDQTEIIYHQLEPYARWALEPEVGWQALEYLFIITGQLKLQMQDGSFKTYNTGDSFYRSPITEHYVFQSIGHTEFIYVTSQPIFQRYSNVSSQLANLAVAIEEKDGYTGDHCARIANLAMKVGEEIV